MEAMGMVKLCAYDRAEHRRFSSGGTSTPYNQQIRKGTLD